MAVWFARITSRWPRPANDLWCRPTAPSPSLPLHRAVMPQDSIGRNQYDWDTEGRSVVQAMQASLFRFCGPVLFLPPALSNNKLKALWALHSSTPPFLRRTCVQRVYTKRARASTHCDFTIMPDLHDNFASGQLKRQPASGRVPVTPSKMLVCFLPGLAPPPPPLKMSQGKKTGEAKREKFLSCTASPSFLLPSSNNGLPFFCLVSDYELFPFSGAASNSTFLPLWSPCLTIANRRNF